MEKGIKELAESYQEKIKDKTTTQIKMISYDFHRKIETEFAAARLRESFRSMKP